MTTTPNDENAENEAADPVPLMQEKLRGDYFHDLIVPRYSALATAEPKPIVIIGVWLLMVPSALAGLLVLWNDSAAQNGSLKILNWTAMVLIAAFQLWVVVKITARRRRRQPMPNEATE